MPTHPLYPHGRAGSLPAAPEQHVSRPDDGLVQRLRAIRADGDEAMTAVEEFDPDFSLKLSACTEPGSADALLADWLHRRTQVLEHTRDRLREAWGMGRHA